MKERRRKRSTATQSRTGVSASGGPCAIHYTMAVKEKKRKREEVAHPCEELNLGFPMESRASLPLDDMVKQEVLLSSPDIRRKIQKNGGDGDRTRYGYRQQILNLPAFPIAYAPRK